MEHCHVERIRNTQTVKILTLVCHYRAGQNDVQVLGMTPLRKQQTGRTDSYFTRKRRKTVNLPGKKGRVVNGRGQWVLQDDFGCAEDR